MLDGQKLNRIKFARGTTMINDQYNYVLRRYFKNHKR